MGLNCNRHCINQVESVCHECSHYETPKHGDEWMIEDEANDHKMLMANGLTHCNKCDTLTNIEQIHGGKCDDCWHHEYLDSIDDEHLNDHPQANEARYMAQFDGFSALTERDDPEPTLVELSNHADRDVRHLARHILNHKHDDPSDDNHLEQT